MTAGCCWYCTAVDSEMGASRCWLEMLRMRAVQETRMGRSWERPLAGTGNW